MRFTRVLPFATLLLAGSAAAQAAEIQGSYQLTNAGEWKPVVHTGHVLSSPAADGAFSVLYAPSEADDPAYRAAIAAAIGGGAVVDYFDTRVATPDVATLSNYDAVYTWANFAYLDNVGFGNNLAAYNDGGGTVVLGTFCTFTSGNFLSGAIMTSAYCPVVSPTGTNHFFNDSYAGDGTSCIYGGVTSLSCTFRDFLVTQGSGVADGHYTDGEICHAFRGTTPGGAGDVVYSNGAGALQLGCSGSWGVAVGNAASCSPGGPPCMFPSSCAFFNGSGINPSGYDCGGGGPIVDDTWNPTISTIPTSGFFTAATIVAVGLGGSTSGTLVFGSELLVLPPFLLHIASGSHTIPIPDDPTLLGVSTATQGWRLEWPNAIVGLNGQTVTFGCQ